MKERFYEAQRLRRSVIVAALQEERNMSTASIRNGTPQQSTAARDEIALLADACRATYPGLRDCVFRMAGLDPYTPERDRLCRLVDDWRRADPARNYQKARHYLALALLTALRERGIDGEILDLVHDVCF